MNEYLISGKDNAPEDWQNNIKSYKGVKVKSRDIKSLIISCSEEVFNQLQEKLSYLKIEYILPHFRDVEKITPP